ncbi:zinc-binding dehydrogenase family oxidoreductase [Rhizodiscina lignyota]|uniref:Zinc-binding dehydrogenase family oxidoreductase n=1 Tax=Rhizodiscina lignyota TaxID=1504668 RepID=A0A9P4M5M8_9PEZI|nr:zinc-binding dehydrogenase family oxidoreductase [Rhizodiscina lignyota]
MTKRGTWELLNTMPVLELIPDSVLIKVETTALNPLDWKLPEFSLSPGSVGGSDFCGTVTAIGSDSLPKSLLVGDRVCGWVFGSNPQRPGNGAFAEYVTAFSDLVMKVPSWMSSEDACTLALASATAGQALYWSLQLPLPTAPAESPFYVLVNGGSTATGTMAIQLLKLSGLIPITTCSPHNFDVVQSYGAKAAFDYRSPTCVDDIQAYTNNSITHVLDCISTPPSMALCYKYTALEPYSTRISASRSDVTADWVLLLTQFGELVGLSGVYAREARPQDRVWMRHWYEVVERLVLEKKLRPHPREIFGSGGLLPIVDGLERLKSGKVSGTKLVCRVA